MKEEKHSAEVAELEGSEKAAPLHLGNVRAEGRKLMSLEIRVRGRKRRGRQLREHFFEKCVANKGLISTQYAQIVEKKGVFPST
jgi:hypothetical protein